jgi:hypothetical protein
MLQRCMSLGMTQWCIYVLTNVMLTQCLRLYRPCTDTVIPYLETSYLSCLYIVYRKVRHIEVVYTYVKGCHVVGTSSVWSAILQRLIWGNNRFKLIFSSKTGILYRKSRKINLDLLLGFKDRTAVFSAEKPVISTTEERQSSQVVRLERSGYICIVKVK